MIRIIVSLILRHFRALKSKALNFKNLKLAASGLALSLALSACGDTPAAKNPRADGTPKPWIAEVSSGGPLKSGYLSDQQWSYASSDWGPVELNRSNGEDAPKDGRPISIGGAKFSKGLGVHATSKITYGLQALNGCTTFSAVVGLDDEIRNQTQDGSVSFEVWTDGAKVWESGLMRVSSNPPSRTVSLPITGKSALELRVTDGGDGTVYDHADWADARVDCAVTAAPDPILNPPELPNADGYVWKPLKVGAGGFITGIDFSSDGSVMIARTDTYGLYRWTGERWKQLLTTASLPAGDIKPNYGAGVFEVAIAPSDKNRVYMVWRDGVYRSDNQGERWTKTSFVGGKLDANDDWRTLGDKLKVDPHNADVLLVGTSKDGLHVSADGGSSFRKLASFPVGQAEKSDGTGPGVTGIDFDAASPAVNGRTSVVYASSFKNGVFKSVDGGDT